MRKLVFFIAFVGCLCFAFACSKSEVGTNREAARSTNSGAATASPAATTSTTTASADKIGIAECDQFLEAYDACVSNKVPEAVRAQYKTTLSQWRSTWRAAAANPQSRATLAASCKQAMEQSRASMKSYGCTF
jgi:hypothetical protein